MLLRNLRTVTTDEIVDIRVKDGGIVSVGASVLVNDEQIDLTDAIVFPGLINSHDHLDFNLFPQLGNKKYNNYVEWGNYIHASYPQIINAVLKIPKDVRVEWGKYKNLVNGVTTVVNHGPTLNTEDNLVSIFQHYHLLHSVQLEKHWKYLLNKPFRKKMPFVVHLGGGGGESCLQEIDNLQKWNLYKREIVGVHCVAMNERQALNIKALVWCPDSNFFLIGKTAAIDKLKSKTSILFGSDSTLSSSWNFWDHLRLAREQGMMTDGELYDTVTTNARVVWNLPAKGKLEAGMDADIVVARKRDLKGYDAFFSVTPADILLVMHKGIIKYADAEIAERLLPLHMKEYSSIEMEGRKKYILGDICSLKEKIRQYYAEVAFPF